jgi:hypothetical protein
MARTAQQPHGQGAALDVMAPKGEVVSEVEAQPDGTHRSTTAW